MRPKLQIGDLVRYKSCKSSGTTYRVISICFKASTLRDIDVKTLSGSSDGFALVKIMHLASKSVYSARRRPLRRLPNQPKKYRGTRKDSKIDMPIHPERQKFIGNNNRLKVFSPMTFRERYITHSGSGEYQ